MVSAGITLGSVGSGVLRQVPFVIAIAVALAGGRAGSRLARRPVHAPDRRRPPGERRARCRLVLRVGPHARRGSARADARARQSHAHRGRAARARPHRRGDRHPDRDLPPEPGARGPGGRTTRRRPDGRRPAAGQGGAGARARCGVDGADRSGRSTEHAESGRRGVGRGQPDRQRRGCRGRRIRAALGRRRVRPRTGRRPRDLGLGLRRRACRPHCAIASSSTGSRPSPRAPRAAASDSRSSARSWRLPEAPST